MIDSEHIVGRRSAPHVLVLDEHLRVAYAAPEAEEIITSRVAKPAFENAVAQAVHGWSDDCREEVIRPVPSLAVRVSRLAGSAGPYVAVLVEDGRRREDVA